MSNNSENLETLISEGRVEYYEHSDFKNISLIGQGSFVNVFCATWKDSRYFALKSFNNDKQLKEIVKEVLCNTIIFILILNLFSIFYILCTVNTSSDG